MPICGTITELLEGRMRMGGGQDRGHVDEDVTGMRGNGDAPRRREGRRGDGGRGRYEKGWDNEGYARLDPRALREAERRG